MTVGLAYESIRTTRGYDDLLAALYMKVKSTVCETDLPPVRVISLAGNHPPRSTQYQDAIAALYGIGYSLKMGLKFGKLPRPKGYFDYKVGALETLWWSTSTTLDIGDPDTLRWQTYLMVPSFVSKELVDEARQLAKAKHTEIPYHLVSLEVVDEGRCVQILHTGPYDKEEPTVDRLHRYIGDRALQVSGRHHEIYISDPRRTAPAKLKTVIRLAVKPDPAARQGAAPGRRRV
jgi:hypothetical protein